MDRNSKFIFSYIFVAKKLRDPKTVKQAIDYIECNRHLFKYTDKQLNDLKKEHGLI
jgi:hypothetical protein